MQLTLQGPNVALFAFTPFSAGVYSAHLFVGPNTGLWNPSTGQTVRVMAGPAVWASTKVAAKATGRPVLTAVAGTEVAVAFKLIDQYGNEGAAAGTCEGACTGLDAADTCTAVKGCSWNAGKAACSACAASFFADSADACATATGGTYAVAVLTAELVEVQQSGPCASGCARGARWRPPQPFPARHGLPANHLNIAGLRAMTPALS